MSNQIVLNALQTQLLEKRNNKEKYRKEVYDPKEESIRQDILNWFRTNVSSKIANLNASNYCIEIARSESPNNRWSSCTIYLEHDYRDFNRKSIKMNWYGSSARLQDENTLLDVEIFGAIASKLSIISHEYTNNWYPLFQELNDPLETMETEIHGIERSLRQVESDMRILAIDTYKQPGFQCTINKKTRCERNWDTEERTYEIKEHDHFVRLSTGRSNYDAVWVSVFKVIKSNNYKVWVEVTQDSGTPNPRPRVYEVSVKKFQAFIEEVYDWQNGGSQKEAEKAKESYDRYTKVEA